MVHEYQLVSRLKGEGYDEEIVISYGNAPPVILFEELTDMLVNSFDGELQMNFNFGGKQFLPYALKRIGEYFILIPRFYALNSGRYPSQKMLLSPEQYWVHSIYQVLIFSKDELFQLWSDLNYDLTELNQISEASQSDLIQLWLISSKYQTREEVLLSVDKYAESVLAAVVAEETSEDISIKDVINKITALKFVLDKPIWNELTGPKFHTVYLLNDDKSICEWKAMAMLNSYVYLVLDKLLIRITLGS